jgi:hypothetical protein
MCALSFICCPRLVEEEGMRCTTMTTWIRQALEMCAVAAAVALSGAPAGAETYLLCAEPNDLRWDLADRLKFRWSWAELSARAVNPAADGKPDPRASGPKLTISAGLTVYVSEGRLSVDVANPVVFEALAENGKPLAWQEYPPGDVRRYPLIGLSYAPSGMTVELPLDPNRPMPSSLTSVRGFVYALYVDDIIKLDVPYDPDGGWLEFEAAPDLMIRVEPSTPHPPGPLEYEPYPPELKEWPYEAWRVKSVGLYLYWTRVNSKTDLPVMALRDAWFPADLRALVNYVVIETQLYDSKKGRAIGFPDHWELAGVPGIGVVCHGETGQDDSSYDTIRHVIGVRPVEVKIPFVLTNIPVPTLPAVGGETGRETGN